MYGRLPDAGAFLNLGASMFRIRNDQPHFRFYPGAYHDRRFEQTGESCDVCETRNAWLYQGAVYGLPPASDVRFCASCLKTGLVYGYLGDAPDALISLNEWSFTTDDVEDALADELLYHSPSPAIWNPHQWPVINREPLVYMGRGDDPMFRNRRDIADAVFREQQTIWPGESRPPVHRYYMIFQSLDGQHFRASLDPD
jgi:uncharacterized protein CbrC (UPF0167 family)